MEGLSRVVLVIPLRVNKREDMVPGSRGGPERAGCLQADKAPLVLVLGSKARFAHSPPFLPPLVGPPSIAQGAPASLTRATPSAPLRMPSDC